MKLKINNSKKNNKFMYSDNLNMPMKIIISIFMGIFIFGLSYGFLFIKNHNFYNLSNPSIYIFFIILLFIIYTYLNFMFISYKTIIDFEAEIIIFLVKKGLFVNRKRFFLNIKTLKYMTLIKLKSLDPEGGVNKSYKIDLFDKDDNSYHIGFFNKYIKAKKIGDYLALKLKIKFKDLSDHENINVSYKKIL